MLFNSYEFILIFFPLLFAGYFLLNRWNRTLGRFFLTGMSAWFYLYLGLASAPVLLVSLVINYASAALIARFENTLGEHFRNAFFFSIRHLGWTFVMCVLMIVVYAAAFLGFLPILILGFGLIVYIDVYILNRIFRPYTKELDEQLKDTF